MAGVGAAIGRKRIKRHRRKLFVAPAVNIRNIHVDPNHDRWCGCVHDLLCKQIFVYVREMCDRGTWQVWEVHLVTNASNGTTDYHLLHLW